MPFKSIYTNLLDRDNQRYELSNDTLKYAHKKVQWINDSHLTQAKADAAASENSFPDA